MTILLQRRPAVLSFARYLEREKRSEIRHEYVDGQVYAMSGGTAFHNRITQNVARAIHSRVAARGCEAFTSDMLVRVRAEQQQRGYYPDVVVACGIEDDTPTVEAPIMIAEVLSPSTKRTEQGEKKEAYLSLASLHHYALVDPDAARIVLYTRGSDGAWQEPVEIVGREAALPLEAFDAAIPLAEIYARVPVD